MAEKLTKDSLVQFLKEHGEVTVQELTYAFGGYPQKHTSFLKKLVADGVLSREGNKYRLASDDVTVRGTYPQYIAFWEPTEIRVGHADRNHPLGWLELGAGDVATVGEVYPFMGYHYVGVRNRRKLPVIALPGRGRALVVGTGYVEASDASLRKARAKRPDVWPSEAKLHKMLDYVGVGYERNPGTSAPTEAELTKRLKF